MPTIVWRTGSEADRALLVLAGLIPLQLVVRDRDWEVVGGNGRRLTGSCTSRGQGRLASLQAVQDAMQRAASEAAVAVRKLG